MRAAEHQDWIKYFNFTITTTSPHWIILWALYKPEVINHMCLNKVSCFLFGKFAVSSNMVGYCLEETMVKIALTNLRSMVSVISFWVTGIVHLFWIFLSYWEVPGSHLLAKISWISLHSASDRQASLQLIQCSDLVVQIFALQDDEYNLEFCYHLLISSFSREYWKIKSH